MLENPLCKGKPWKISKSHLNFLDSAVIQWLLKNDSIPTHEVDRGKPLSYSP